MFPSKVVTLTNAQNWNIAYNKARFPSNESKRTKSSLLDKLALNTTEKSEKPLNIIIFIYDKLLASQSEQTKLNKCCRCFQRWMPAVWERSHIRQLYRNTLMTVILSHSANHMTFLMNMEEFIQ